jgi:hypothetical protein
VLSGTNLLDRESVEGAISFADSLGYGVRSFGDPRAFVLEL